MMPATTSTPTPGPYAQAALDYWRAGWHAPLPLPARAKKDPPRGFTGRGGVDPSFPDVYTWTETKADGNIGLRMPDTIVGIDVDDYGDKPGRTTIATYEAINGPLPASWRSTSRAARGRSGIVFYRVPPGLAWPGQLDGGGVELIQRGHRYAVVWPSVHPEGGTYQWYDPDGNPSIAIPRPDQLPALPDAWVQTLTGGRAATESTKATVGDAAALQWIASQPHATDPQQCDAVRSIVASYLASAAAAHTAMTTASAALVRHAEGRHHGVVDALIQVRTAFIGKVTARGYSTPRTPDEAAREWTRSLTGAVGMCVGDPGPVTCDCYGELTAAITGIPAMPVTTPPPDPYTAPDDAEVQEAAAEAVEATGNPLLDVMVSGAAFILDSPEVAPAIWGQGEEILWAKGEALMLCGPPGVGKTTLAGQVVKARLTGGTVLGWPVEPTSSRVLYLAMDRPRQIARALRRHFTPADRAILDQYLIVWPGPLPADVAKTPGLLYALAQLAMADTIIVDSLKDAAIGITEDETGAAYNLARQKCLANGVEMVELHHMVKRAEGRKPTTLQDVYGSMHLTSGAGSVVILWGAGGDLVVDLVHVKQPMAEVGPLQVEHDHVAGVSTISHGTDLLSAIAAAGSMTAREVAGAMFSKSPDSVDRNEKQKGVRRAEKLVRDGLLEAFDDWSAMYQGQPAKAYRVAHGVGFQGTDQGTRQFSASAAPSGYANGETPSREGTGQGTQGTDGQGTRAPAPLGAVAQAPTPYQRAAVHPSVKACSSCSKRDDSYIVDLLGGKCSDCAEVKP